MNPKTPYNPKNFYSYFRDCYKLDYKEFVVDNVLAQKYSHKWFVNDQEELLTQSLPLIPYPNKKVDELEKDIQLYQLEKKLFYAAFFILGNNNNPFIKDKRYCAPLLLFPAKIVTLDDEKFLEIDRDSLVVNRSVLSHLELKDQAQAKDEFIQEITDFVMLQDEHIIRLKSILEKYFDNLDCEDLLLLPQVWKDRKIRSYLKENEFEETQFKVIPAAGTVFVNQSESSLKVINDLNAMTDQKSFNTSLSDLLTGNAVEAIQPNSIYKSRLNEGQLHALENAYRYSNSVIVGPPGTGKSYTITSIVSDLVSNNQSVLVVSKTKQAVEVLRTMLHDDFKLGEFLIHTTGARYKYSLKSKIRRYLSGILSARQVHFNKHEVHNLNNKLDRLQVQFEELIDLEIELSDLEFGTDLNFWEKIRKFLLNNFLNPGKDLWDFFDEINYHHELLEEKIKTYSKRKLQSNIRKNSSIYRTDIAKFYDALDASSFTEYKDILDQVMHQNILRVFPVWLSNLGELNSVLPLQKDLFDVVLIDEATQCDIATALPAIYRAKRVVVVGDPNQLRHYSFVSQSQQNQLQKKHALPSDKIFDYRNRSILDLFVANIKKQEQVSFLREHFRSTPSLIEFSNLKFYDGQLEVLKSTPKHTTVNQIELIQVDGSRNNKGVNETEAEAVIALLQSIFKDHQESMLPPSIGIISPFTSQVRHINKLLTMQVDIDVLKRHNVFCGTPYSFQGSEREIVLLSFALCDDSHHSAFIHANKPEVLNVAITRAKSYQYVFKSASEKAIKKGSLLFDYFRFVQQFSHTGDYIQEKDQFQIEVLEVLKQKEITDVRCAYPVAGSLLDILVTHNKKNYFIDLIGYPGMFKEAFTFERYQTLARTGIKSFPLHYSQWKKNKDECILRLLRFLN